MSEPPRPRRTRAHPSPGGLSALPMDQPTRKPRKPRQPRKKKGVNEVAFAPMPAPEAPQEPAAQSTTSHSPSPESQSESPQPQIPESRSTSPPNQQFAQPTTTSRTTAKDQQQGSKRSANSTGIHKRRTRDNDRAGEHRPAKRSRTRVNSRPAAESQRHGDSSSDADVPQPFTLPTTPSHNDSSEAEMDEDRSNQARATPNSSVQQRLFLSPKSKRTKTAKQIEQKTSETKKPELMTNDMKERERYYFEKYGKKMPVYKPQLNALLRKGIDSYGPALHTEVDDDDESEEDLGEEYIDGPSFTRMALDNWKNDPSTFRREDIPFQIPPQSTDSPKVYQTRTCYYYCNLLTNL
jgi:hypothetical protein